MISLGMKRLFLTLFFNMILILSPWCSNLELCMQPHWVHCHQEHISQARRPWPPVATRGLPRRCGSGTDTAVHSADDHGEGVGASGQGDDGSGSTSGDGNWYGKRFLPEKRKGCKVRGFNKHQRRSHVYSSLPSSSTTNHHLPPSTHSPTPTILVPFCTPALPDA